MSWLLLFSVNLLTCAGQLLQKRAIIAWQGQNLTLRQKLFSPWLLAGLSALGCGLLLWLWVLRLMPLSVAYPMLSLNFVLVTLASRYWFGESTHVHHWFGIMLIMLGIILLGGLL